MCFFCLSFFNKCEEIMNIFIKSERSRVPTQQQLATAVKTQPGEQETDLYSVQVCRCVCVCVCVNTHGIFDCVFVVCVLCLCDRLTCTQMVDDEHMNFTSHFTC